jgi:hypothetical protein
LTRGDGIPATGTRQGEKPLAVMDDPERRALSLRFTEAQLQQTWRLESVRSRLREADGV